MQLALFREAEKSYETNTGERVLHWQRRLLARYTRNLALADHALTRGHLRSDRRGALARGRQLRLGSVGDGQPLSARRRRRAT